MNSAIEERVEQLEKEVRELKQRIGTQAVGSKAWQESLGMIEDTPMAREAFALGEEYRRAQKTP